MAILERDGALVALVLPDLEAIRGSGSPRVDEVIRVTLSEAAMNLPSYERISGYGWYASRCRRRDCTSISAFGFQRFTRPPKPDGRTRRTSRCHTRTRRCSTASRRARCLAFSNRATLENRLSLDASPMLDLGIDSLEWIALALVLEQQAGVYLDESMAGESLTVRDLLLHAATMPEGRSAGNMTKPSGIGLSPQVPCFGSSRSCSIVSMRFSCRRCSA